MIRNWLRNFMIGRYGPDQLNIALLILAVVMGFLGTIFDLLVLTLIGDILLILTLFRMFSKNITARRRENDRFIKVWWPIRTKVKNKIAQFKARKNYRFFKCPECKKTLRVPKGKGKIQITCPKCGERFIKKT